MSETKTISLRIAKAGKEDLDVLYRLANILDWVEHRGDVEGSGGPYYRDSGGSCEFLLDAIERLAEDGAGGRIWRAVGNLATLLDSRNAVVDPDADHVALHPRFNTERLSIDDAPMATLTEKPA